MAITIQPPMPGQSGQCEPILRALPEWFGIEEAVQQYLDDIKRLPTVLASMDDQVVGFLTAKLHTPQAAEILVMGVKPSLHRNGVGRTLVTEVEAYLMTQGIMYLQVKTLSASHPDKHYARTRQFYLALGFKPLEEFPTLWGAENPCLQMIKALKP